MTTDAPINGAPAPDAGGAVDPYEGLIRLLPKLVHPSWHKHAHSGMYHENRHKHEVADAAVEKAKRRVARKVSKASRISRAIAGEHTRARPVAA